MMYGGVQGENKEERDHRSNERVGVGGETSLDRKGFVFESETRVCPEIKSRRVGSRKEGRRDRRLRPTFTRHCTGLRFSHTDEEKVKTGGVFSGL